MADLDHAFKGRPAGEHTNTEAPHNELDAEIHNDIELAIVDVNTDAESLLAFVRGLDKAIVFEPDIYETDPTVGINAIVQVALGDGSKNPFSNVQYAGVEILEDTTGGAVINGSATPITIPISFGEGQVNVWAPGVGHVKLGLVDAGGTGLDVTDTAMVYVGEAPPVDPEKDSYVFNRDGELIKVLQDLEDDGLGLIEVQHNGLPVGQRRKVNFTGTGIAAVVLENGTVRVEVAGGGGGSLDELFNADPAVTLLDAVNIDGDSHVQQADASDPVKIPVVGFAVSSGGPGMWYVRTVGKVSGFIAKMGGLVAGQQYWADPGTPGGIITPVPYGSGVVMQPVGIAKNADELLLQIQTDMLSTFGII
jgi:hypothetical protein